MESAEILAQVPGALLPWYEANKRILPWREDREPYHIWLSEIMLQQTRVEAVKGYYQRFLQALPDIASLANAPEEQLYKLWEGLGYYSRVRNLQKAAKVIVDDFDGQFPSEHKDVLSLPGIGPYTAGAICSIAFDLPTAAVDGNVLRLVSRLTDDSTPIDAPAYRKQVQLQLEAIYPQEAGVFTQALMELGATLCGPNRKPDCIRCPCKGLCKAYQNGTAEQLPVKGAKKARRTEEKTVFILRWEGRYALRKRSDKGLLADMWEFPNVPGKLQDDALIAKVEEFGLIPIGIHRKVERKHIFTHIEWDMSGVYMDVKNGNDFVWLTPEQIREETALPTAFRQFWTEIECFL